MFLWTRSNSWREHADAKNAIIKANLIYFINVVVLPAHTTVSRSRRRLNSCNALVRIDSRLELILKLVGGTLSWITVPIEVICREHPKENPARQMHSLDRGHVVSIQWPSQIILLSFQAPESASWPRCPYYTGL